MSDWRTSSVVRIWGPDKASPVGVGFVLDDEHVMTCAHVVGAALGNSDIAGASEPPVDPILLDFLLLSERGQKPDLVSAKVVEKAWRPINGASRPSDVAVLRLTDASRPADVSPVRTSRIARQDDLLTACGVKKGQPFGTWIEVKVTGSVGGGMLEVFAGHQDLAVDQGCSGGAAFAALDGIVGMVTSRFTGTNKGLIIPAEQLRQVWPIEPVEPHEQREPYRVEGRPSRFFISYRRRAADDAKLAKYLRERLEAANHEVFIDVSMPAGIDWGTEIDKRIKWCDFLIVLLSEHSIHSPMVQTEVRIAHHDRRDNGRPGILPIRVNFDGQLDYELSNYIGRLQYLSWKSLADNDSVLDAVLRSASLGVLKSDTPPDPVAPEPDDARRPVPSVDRSKLVVATGTLKLDDPLYLRRSADDIVEQVAARRGGQTLVIKGPWQMGKSSLLLRYLDRCAQNGKKRAFVDFQLLSNQQLTDYQRFLAGFAKILFRRFALAPQPLPPDDTDADSFTHFVAENILARIDEPVTIACDEADRVLGQPWQTEFFGMLRTWHNARADRPDLPEWGKVDLALVISTESSMLIKNEYQSPFNVGDVVKIGALRRQDVEELSSRYGAELSANQIEETFNLFGGHPYLTRLALYRIVTDSTLTFRKLVDTA